MRKKITLFMMSLLVLLGSSESMWGQNGVLAPDFLRNTNPQQAKPVAGDISARRGDAVSGTPGYIEYADETVNAANVNNIFGAGESATIAGNNLSWPGTHSLNAAAPTTALQIGSDGVSQNIVMNTYNAGGYATEFLTITANVASTGSGTVTTSRFTSITSYTGQNPTTAFFPSFTPTATSNWPWPITSPSVSGTVSSTTPITVNLSIDQQNFGSLNGLVGAIALTNSATPVTFGSWYVGSVDFFIGLHTSSTVLHHWRLKEILSRTPYTTERAGNDDNGIPLVQADGSKLINASVTVAAANVAPGSTRNGINDYVDNPDDSRLVNYVRPTTIAVENVTNFDQITIHDLNWWYRAHNMEEFPSGGSSVMFDQNPSGSAYLDINPFLICAHTNRQGYKTTQIGEWQFNTVQGANFLDAAVQIISGASVCVSGNVEDVTTSKRGEIGYTEGTTTNAVLAFPIGGHNYSLLVGQNYNDLAMVHDGSTDNQHYWATSSNQTIPADPTGAANLFPTVAATDIYLNFGTQSASPVFNFKGGPGGTGYLLPTNVANNYYSNLANPAALSNTQASIFGVYGNYSGSSNIHTADGLGSQDNNPGVIEIGPQTLGQGLFHIYSGGILKNFWSSCTPQNTVISVGHSDEYPYFYFDGDAPLYILNDGNNYNSGIILSAAAASALGTEHDGTNYPGNGFENASGSGDLHIQAHAFIDILGNLDLQLPDVTSTGTHNNVSILSDHAYIKTKDVTYDGGQGNLTVWARGTTETGSGTYNGGYIDMGAVNITNTGTKGDGPPVYNPLSHNAITPACTYIPDPTNNPQAANTLTSLGSFIQTRIQSNNSYVDKHGLFTFTSNRGGALLVQGQDYVRFREDATIKLADNAVTADVAIQSKGNQVLFDNLFSYTSAGEGTDLFIDGYTGVTFHGGKIQQIGGLTTPTNIGIQAPRGNVNFYGNTITPIPAFSIDVVNTNNVQVWANNNIDIQSELVYSDHPGTPTFVQFYANDSILTNANWKGAPVRFTSLNTTAPTTTDWVAWGNIHTRDVLTFNYGTSGSKAGPLTVKSLGGNIVFDRATNIFYDSENRVLISAEIPCDPKNAANEGYTGGDGGNRNRNNGNIFANDNLIIGRTNQNQGTTDILAKYNIRTAAVAILNAAAGNTTNVISDMGDLFLGYSTVPANPGGTPAPFNSNKYSYDDNAFVFYSSENSTGMLNIISGYGDAPNNKNRDGGGNIYFTKFDITKDKGGNHGTEITIPYSYEYWCGSAWIKGKLNERLKAGFEKDMMHYEHSGIIGGVGRCGVDNDWANYTGILYLGLTSPLSAAAKGPSLSYKANHGYLLVDAGKNGNIIMNTGSSLDFQGNNGQGWFRTRKGDIDMRGQTNVDGLAATKGLVFLADNGEADKSKIVDCTCDEQFNNVYMQDFDFATFSTSTDNKGSIYFGADNNIKLQYGGLRDIGTWKDPFLSNNKGYGGGGILCASSFHCDADSSQNKARPMILDYRGKNNGGVGVVASDMIDVYKRMVYYGGATGKGMDPVPAAPIPAKPANAATYNPNNPGDGKLHGENVAGYGLYVKAQGNKGNWTRTPFDPFEFCPPACALDICGTDAYLHQVARVTFHDDARIVADNSKAYVGSPVLEVFGNLDLNTSYKSGSSVSNQLLHIQTDSLIVHDSLILDGNNLRLTTWSALERNMPIIKLGHQRFTPPKAEDACPTCFTHTKGTGKISNHTALDTINVTFRNGASLSRLHTLVADHTVLTLLSDIYDGTYPNLPPVYDAMIFTDTFKIRNQVELWTQTDKKRDGHFELVSEPQMWSKNTTGIYARHLHMEPIAPDCSKNKYSELWIPTTTLDVVSTSTFGGYGTVHSNVFVEIAGRIAPGYASLGAKGNCYEQIAGTLKMQDLRMDKDAELHYSIGTDPGFNGELADCIEVDHLIMRGDINIYVEKRCGQDYKPGCYPIIRYNSVEDAALNNLKLGTTRIDGYNLALDFSQKGVVQLCIAEPGNILVQRQVVLPEPPDGVRISPNPGVHWVPWGNNFNFTLDFFGRDALAVYTDRYDDLTRTFELLTGKLNSNGEYEYTLINVKTQPIRIYIGVMPTGNELLEKTAVWSSGNTLYIKVSHNDIASIYSITGNLVNRIDVPDGGITQTLSRGAYIVTLKDGSVHKIIIR